MTNLRRPFYANVNPQTALAASIHHIRLPHLSKLSASWYVVLVSDSYTVFLAGKNTSVDPAGDPIEQTVVGVFSQYRALVYQPMWGKTLAVLVAQAAKAVEDFWAGLRNEVWPNEVKIDVAIAWLGNELVGERGLFLNPAYDVWREKYYGPHAAGGDWKEVADRVCTSLSELAALRGRPGLADVIGVTSLMGQPDPKRYSLPHQFDECMQKFFAYARGQGVQTASIARISDSIALYDSFHFRENSASRKKLAEHFGHQLRVLIAEFTASQISLNRLEEIYRRHAYSDKGKTFIPVVYQRPIGDAEAGLRTNKVKAKLAELDPLDPEFWAAQEEA